MMLLSVQICMIPCRTQCLAIAVWLRADIFQSGQEYWCRNWVKPEKALTRLTHADAIPECRPAGGIDWDNLGFGIENVAPVCHC